MPLRKKRKLARENIELACEFSECMDKCSGMDEFMPHVSLHISIMRDQLKEAVSGDADDDETIDRTRCECPWRHCSVTLDITDWAMCVRHINFHAFHTNLKALGDEELETRGVAMQCSKEHSQRNTIPELPESLQCRWTDCTYQSDNPWQFYRHVNNHASEGLDSAAMSMRKCRWSSCEYSKFGTVTKLSDHLRTHTQERKYACSNCGLLYSQSTRLEDHMKRQAVDEKSFQCSHCNKKCSTERLLRDHLRKHLNLYGCMFCEMTCPSPSALRIHILYRHSTERPFTCSKCDNTFKTKFDLATHDLVHEFKDKLFECTIEFCGFRTKNAGNIQRHLNEMHSESRIYACHICDCVYPKGRDLSAHLKNVHQLKYPSGHVKFRFAPEADGIWRLVTLRYECFQDGEEEEEEEEEEQEEGEEDEDCQMPPGCDNGESYSAEASTSQSDLSSPAASTSQESAPIVIDCTLLAAHSDG